MSPPRFAIGETVRKRGKGYHGPGIVVTAFPAIDTGAWRYVVGHTIQGGGGVFYHIYTEDQLAPLEAETADAAQADPA